MDGTCCLSGVDSLASSVMEPASRDAIFYPYCSSISEVGRVSLKRTPDDKNFDCRGFASQKQRKLDDLEVPRSPVSPGDVTHLTKSSASKESKWSDSQCQVSAAAEMADSVSQDELHHIDPGQRQDILLSSSGSVQTKLRGLSPEARFTTPHEGSWRSESLPDLGFDFRPVGNEMSELVTDIKCEQEVQRCRSLPCRMSPERGIESLKIPATTVPISNVSVSLSESSTDKNNRFSGNLETDKRGNSDHDDNNSNPASPSSCFIDVEADPSPLSPLNLTVNDPELKVTNSLSADNAPTTKGESVEETIGQGQISNFPNMTESVFHKNVQETEKEKQRLGDPTKEKLQDKKTNFSIDYILRPDFGAGRVSKQTSTSFQPLSVHRPRLGASIRSAHSAFTAVDLSTRSRSDSLSSPSCSSSSPSPPPQTSTPPSQLKPEFSRVAAYDKRHLGQKNFLFPAQMFAETGRRYENYFNGHVPFLSSLHGNGLESFPFIYSPQNSPDKKVLTDKDYCKHQAENMRIKPELPKSDISKLFTRTLYPFITNPHPSRSDILKLSRHHGDQIKTGSDAALQVLRQSKQGSAGNTSPSSQRQETDFESRTASQATSDQDTSANCKKMALKHEKSGQKDGDSTRKAGNPTWPAWVFCTRYSDRPSSGMYNDHYV